MPRKTSIRVNSKYVYWLDNESGKYITKTDGFRNVDAEGWPSDTRAINLPKTSEGSGFDDPAVLYVSSQFSDYDQYVPPKVTPTSAPKLVPGRMQVVRVKNRYDTQRDNKLDPFSACGPTSMAMACDAFGVEVPNGGEDSASWIFRKLRAPRSSGGYGMQVNGTVGLMAEMLTKTFKFHDEVVWSMSWQKYVDLIDTGHLVILHTAAQSLTRSGHIVLLSGYDLGKKVCIVDDPYGEAIRGTYGYQSGGQQGENEEYSFDWIFNSGALLAAHILKNTGGKLSYDKLVPKA